jgi:hypothetical protein
VLSSYISVTFLPRWPEGLQMPISLIWHSVWLSVHSVGSKQEETDVMDVLWSFHNLF